MNKIGTLDIVDTRTFIVPPNESVWLTVNTLGWIFKLNVVFEPTAAVHGIRIEPQPDHARIVIAKWGSSLGTATKVPVELGTHSSGRKLFFMATHYFFGDDPAESTVKFDIQFLLEAAAHD